MALGPGAIMYVAAAAVCIIVAVLAVFLYSLRALAALGAWLAVMHDLVRIPIDRAIQVVVERAREEAGR